MDYRKIQRLKKMVEEIAPYYEIALYDDDEALAFSKPKPDKDKEEDEEEVRIGFE